MTRARRRVTGYTGRQGMHAMAAQDCALCGGGIGVGDLIAKTRRGNAHKGCVEREHGE